MTSLSKALVLALFLLAAPTAALGDDKDGVAIEKLIDRLALGSFNRNERLPGFGFPLEMFLPLPKSLLIPDAALSEAPTLLETYKKDYSAPLALIERGAGAVPQLLAHLGDRRASVVRFRVRILGGLDFAHAMDRNPRLSPTDRYGAPDPGTPIEGVDRMRNGSITVGDVCFVILGQILNREFRVDSPRGSSGLWIHSPCGYPELIARIRKVWAGLDARKHRALLIDDFRRPDRPERRVGAYLRLCYYYPKAVEPLLLEALDGPFYDEEVAARVARYLTQPRLTLDQARAACRRHIERQGPAAAKGLLFELWHLRRDDGRKPRIEALIRAQFPERYQELVVKDAGFKDWPGSWQALELLLQFLIFDQSKAVDERVMQLCLERSEPEFLYACASRLLERGYRPQIKARVAEALREPPRSWSSQRRSAYLEKLRALNEKMGKN